MRPPAEIAVEIHKLQMLSPLVPRDSTGYDRRPLIAFQVLVLTARLTRGAIATAVFDADADVPTILASGEEARQWMHGQRGVPAPSEYWDSLLTR